MKDLSLRDFRTDFLKEGVYRFVVITSAPETCEADYLDVEAFSGFRAHALKAPFKLCLRLLEYIMAEFNLTFVKQYDYFHAGQLLIAATDKNGNFPMEVCWGGKPGKHNCTWETFTSLRDALKFVEKVENAFIGHEDTASMTPG